MGTSINGDKYDWGDVTLILRTGEQIGVEEINYGDEIGGSPRYGKGYTPNGYGGGNYKGAGDMTLDRAEADLLRVALGGSIYKGAGEIIVSYSGDDKLTRGDVMPSVKFKKQNISNKQGDANAGQTKLEFECLEPIKWNGLDAM